MPQQTTEKTGSPTTATAPTAPAESTAGPLTRQRRDALFAAVSKTMAPEHAKVRAKDPLLGWRSQIVKTYKKGYSLRQIAQILSAPEINVKTSVRSLQRLLQPRPSAKPAAGK